MLGLKMIFRIAKWLLGIVAILIGTLLIYAFAVPRPQDTTDSAIFERDGSLLNYCELPILDGSGKTADDIPKAYTPGCGYTTVPMPILAQCTEPLAEGVVDMRGLWFGESSRGGHLERIEQCGNRVVVTAFGIIHDFRMDGTLKNGARDIQSYCTNFASAIKVDEQGKVIFRLFDLFDTVSRHLDDGNMIFTFVDGMETRMRRTCSMPEDRIGMYEAGF